MAGYVQRAYKYLDRNIANVLKNHTSDGAIKIFRRHHLKPKYDKKEITGIIKEEGKRVKTPIVISSKHFRNKFANADGLATRPHGKSKILLHPIVKYYPRKYIRILVDHEKDHIRNYEERDYQTKY